MVVWERQSGEDIERAIATYICLKYPHSVRVRPSQGDGGIDVIRTFEDGKVSIYQIKKFASNLTMGQKKQIENSWKRFIEYAKTEHLGVAEWSLVLPLDPTPQNRKWFESLTGGESFRTSWIGLTEIDGWAAEMPRVADYYFNGDRDAVLALAKTFLDATHQDITSEAGLRKRLSSIQETLDTIDPNYRFDFQVMSGSIGDMPTSAPGRPGLVMTAFEEIGNGKVVQIDVLAKHTAATALSPISGTVTFRPESSEQEEELRKFIDYGEPFSGLPASLDMSTWSAFEMGEFPSTGKVSVFGRERKRNVSLFLSDVNGNSIEVIQRSSSEGRKGLAWKGSSDDGFICVEAHADYGSSSLSASVKVNLGCLVNAPIGKARRKLNFLAGGFENELSLRAADSEICRFLMSDLGVDKEFIDRALVVAQLLATIDVVSADEVLFPMEINVVEMKALSNAAKLVSTGCAEIKWAKLELSEPPETLPPSPLEIQYAQKLAVRCGGRQYNCGYVLYNLFAAWNERMDAYVPLDEENGIARISYLGQSLAPDMVEDALYVRGIPDDTFGAVARP